MKVVLPSGHIAVVDLADASLVGSAKWYALPVKDTTYVATFVSGRTLYLHRLLVGASPGVEVDHHDGDGLNNRRSNLRCTTHKLNLANQRPQQGRSSPFKGVSLYSSRGCWEAYIKVDGKKIRLGYFEDEMDAAKAYDAAALEAWGEFARTNFG